MLVSLFNIQKEQCGVKKNAGIDECVGKRKNKARKMSTSASRNSSDISDFLGNVCTLLSWEIDQD